MILHAWGINAMVRNWNNLKVTFFLAKVRIGIFSTLGATHCFPKSVDIVLLALLSLLRLLLLLVLLAARLRQLLYLQLFPAELSVLHFS
jgi:hypothetical protein